MANKTRRKYRTMRPTNPNAGIEAAYRKKLLQLTRDLMKDLPTEPVDDYYYVLGRFLETLRDAEVTERFYREAERIALLFVNRASNYTKAALVTALQNAGYNPRTLQSLRTVPGALENVKAAVYRENVALIRRIPEEVAQRIEKMVNASVMRGRDIGGMVKDLKTVPGMTARRAANIARDQNNKATESMSLVRVQALGITHGIWRHRYGGIKPRESHVAMDGERFLLSEGLYDVNEGRNVFPAELPFCRCEFMPVLPDLE